MDNRGETGTAGEPVQACVTTWHDGYLLPGGNKLDSTPVFCDPFVLNPLFGGRHANIFACIRESVTLIPQHTAAIGIG